MRQLCWVHSERGVLSCAVTTAGAYRMALDIDLAEEYSRWDFG